MTDTFPPENTHTYEPILFDSVNPSKLQSWVVAKGSRRKTTTYEYIEVVRDDIKLLPFQKTYEIAKISELVERLVEGKVIREELIETTYQKVKHGEWIELVKTHMGLKNKTTGLHSLFLRSSVSRIVYFIPEIQYRSVPL